VEGIGSVVIPVGVAENVKELHDFLYPRDEEYALSDTVMDIAKEIETNLRCTKKYFEHQSTGYGIYIPSFRVLIYQIVIASWFSPLTG
jgi:hypothetical protein